MKAKREIKTSVAAVVLGIIQIMHSATAAEKPKGAGAPSEPGPALIQKVMDAWNTGNLENVAPFYAQDPTNVFFDVAPLKFTGWNEYAEASRKLLGNYSSVTFTLNPDAQTHRGSGLAWGTATMHGELIRKNGMKESMDARYTVVWEKRGHKWLIVHDHASVPLGARAASG